MKSRLFPVPGPHRKKSIGIKSSVKPPKTSASRSTESRKKPGPKPGARRKVSMENPPPISPSGEPKSSLPSGPPQPEYEDQPEPMNPLAYSGAPPRTSDRPLSTQTAIAVAFRHIRPFWRNYIQYVDLAARGGDDRAKKYLAVWNGVTQHERRHHFPEQLCEMAGIMPDRKSTRP